MKKYSYTALASMVSMSLTLMICQSVTHASDIEIYSNSTNGKTTITLMLDTSGSMSIGGEDVSACDIPSSSSGKVTTGSILSGTTPAYTRRYCEVGGGDERRYYFMRNNNTWYSCVDRNGSIDRNQCNNKMSNKPTDDELADLTASAFYYYAYSCNNYV
ncbi:MAG: hypothetical protein L0G61_02910, partial [Staphylococcus equorum]|nr:hypothetical protein [Staphylococcus equorum]